MTLLCHDTCALAHLSVSVKLLTRNLSTYYYSLLSSRERKAIWKARWGLTSLSMLYFLYWLFGDFLEFDNHISPANVDIVETWRSYVGKAIFVSTGLW